MNIETQLWLRLGCCALYTLIAFLFYKFPPKENNVVYGYRTKRSMANPEIWEAANSYSASLMLKMALAGFIFPIVLYFIFPTYNFLITIAITTLMLVSVLWFTEKHLDLNFDKQGNPRSMK